MDGETMAAMARGRAYANERKRADLMARADVREREGFLGTARELRRWAERYR